MKIITLLLCLLCSSHAYYPLPLDSAVVSYYNFDNITWSTQPGIGDAHDLIYPSYSMHIFTPTSQNATGFVNKGLQLMSPNSSGLTSAPTPMPATTYSVEALINWHDTSDFSGVVYGVCRTTEPAKTIWDWGFDKGKMYVGDVSVVDTKVSTAYPFQHNIWYYIAITYDRVIRSDGVEDSQLTFYINGIKIFSILGVSKIGWNARYRLGDNYVSPGTIAPSMIGIIDEFRVSNVARSEDDIMMIWNVINGTTKTELSPQVNLQPVYPNPFNRSQGVRFDTDGAIVVYDLTGRMIRRLTSLVWDGTDAHGAPAAAGTYLYRITGDIPQVGKIILR